MNEYTALCPELISEQITLDNKPREQFSATLGRMEFTFVVVCDCFIV